MPVALKRPSSRSLAGVVVFVLLVVQLLSRVVDLGSAETDLAIADWSYRLLMIGGAAAVLLRAAVVPQQRLAWGLIGVGLTAWAAGDLYYDTALIDDAAIPYPSLTDGLYFVLYGALIAGLGVLAGPVRGRLISLDLAVLILGLATLWSGLVFSEVLAGATGGTAAVATTLAYPLLDLVLLTATLLLSRRAMAARPLRSHLPSASR